MLATSVLSSSRVLDLSMTVFVEDFARRYVAPRHCPHQLVTDAAASNNVLNFLTAAAGLSQNEDKKEVVLAARGAGGHGLYKELAAEQSKHNKTAIGK